MKKLALAVMLLGGVWLVWPGGDDGEADLARPSDHTVFDRVWITDIPQEPKQKFEYVIVLHDSGHFGVFGKTSAYEGWHSAFEYEHDKSKRALRIKMLQTDKKRKVKYTFKKGGCEPFDYCLELETGGKTKRYGSMEDWVIESKSDLEDQTRALVYGE